MGMGWIVAAGAGVVGLLLLLKGKAKASLPPWPAGVPRTVRISVLRVQRAINIWIAKGQLPGPRLVEDGEMGPRILRPLLAWPVLIKSVDMGITTLDIDPRIAEKVGATLS